MNAHQAALIQTLNVLQNSLKAVKAACQGVRNLTANFPEGSLPVISTDVQACDDAMDGLISSVVKDMNLATEFVNLE